MNIIVVGAGEIGRHMAQSLSEESHSITVIESDEGVAKELEGQFDGRVIQGDGTSVNTLLEAGVSGADLFMALTADNNVNLVASSMAKKLGSKKVICRVLPGLQRDEWLFDLRAHFGIDYVFSAERLAAAELSKFIRNPDSIVVEELARGHIELQQVRVSPNSEARGKTLEDLDFPSRVRVGAITREGKSITPSADEVLKAGDFVTLFGEPKRLHDVVMRLNHSSGKEVASNVAIFGGGDYGYSLAETLEGWNCRVRIFENDEKRCDELSEHLTSAKVLNIDATSVAELKEENIEEVDFFVAATGVDEDNVMTCLQAQSIGAKHCLTLIHRADYADAIMGFGERVGIMAAVSPRDATKRDLMRFVTSDPYHLVKKLETSELIEASVAEGSKADGHKVKDINWPAGCVLAALLHGVRAVTPAADDEIVAGDHLYAVVTSKAKKKFLKLIH
ncbi:MAG: Trk system potassium transporter TrkA [Verrucomicrobia bacterium]|nr:Trk system potassium transporter TrkA [Verrucomicrobiota bacterium]